MPLRPYALTLLALTFACAGGDDAPADDTDDTDVAETDDTEPVESGLVEITIFDRTTRAPDANEAVLFFNADGSFVSEETTDTDGKASAVLDEGGTVVVMVRNDEDALPYFPVAYVGVQPGDALTFLGGARVQGTSEVSFPTAAGANAYRFSAVCGEQASNASQTNSSPIDAPACEDASVILVARNGSTLVGGLGATGLDTTAAVSLDGPWVVPTAFELAVTGLTAETETVSLEAQHALGAARTLGGAFDSGAPSARRYGVTGTMVPLEGLTVVALVGQERAGYGRQLHVVRRPYASDLSIDVADLTLPWIAAPVFDPEDRTLRWTEEGAGVVDALVGGPFLARGEASFGWSIGFAPAGATEVVLPELPEPWTDYNPAAGDVVEGEYVFVRGEGLADTVRRDPVEFLDRVYGFDVPEPQVDHGQVLLRVEVP